MAKRGISILSAGKLLGLLLAGSTLSSLAHAEALDDIKARGTLICGTQNASAPYAFQDPASRTFVGYDVDMCKALAKSLGVKLEHRPLSTEARIPELKMGRVDLVAGSMAYLPERAEQVDFSLQYLQGAIKVMVKKDSGIKTLADLAGRKVCASKGSSSAAIAARVLPKAQVLTFQDVASCYLGLQSDKVEGFTAGELALKCFEIDSQGKGNPVMMVPEPTYVEHMGIVTNKNNPKLIAAINEAILQMDKSGELSATFEKWLGEQSIYKLKRTFKVEPVDKAS
ncbi:MAG: ABC transporter substrate-binding protein [Candidatus Dactylopiibacterium carminicum]|uniref:ABC transporter substrate-binding protein n=1 Tax=Candidatus Dactylopiibacterium carminicum TaxID=857335 RepID=A0A272EX85_9RHOO|nr:ABC transporter substrate-binding protein [Candidatus Dactylopiibacterium carminicum]KAF7599613.1 ABC transporter substrate-binding protein [Candidatus Dactylopiibacterium carminicum]PAS94260.1 MAG: ABC transporter substrate-binding protein [Candidatus Dactylopiibacterium carminicum]PAS98456.1 MAG: ABC transporter substrate-binding protein [Candidatus Dactylopiibacterium carminicum]PAS99616.1 MAG: ABC transporter substrate-binding protein [Candidatus Dactylopiibacterium carminicum]